MKHYTPENFHLTQSIGFHLNKARNSLLLEMDSALRPLDINGQQMGILLALIGSVITFKAMVVETEGGDKIGAWAWKPLFFILAANFVFGILLGGLPSIGLPAMGMILGIYALVIISSLAGNEFSLKGVLGLSTILAIGSYLAFVVLLKLQFPVWPSFITG